MGQPRDRLKRRGLVRRRDSINSEKPRLVVGTGSPEETRARVVEFFEARRQAA